MSEFKREKVLFHIIGQGEVTVEYEVGAETPEQAFRRAYDESVAGITRLMILSDVEFVTTVTTEPMQDDPMLNKRAAEWREAYAQQAQPDDPDWESRINWTNRSDVELAHHLSSDHDFVVTRPVTRTELNLLHDQRHDIEDQRESDEYARAREDEADQWRMNPLGHD